MSLFATAIVASLTVVVVVGLLTATATSSRVGGVILAGAVVGCTAVVIGLERGVKANGPSSVGIAGPTVANARWLGLIASLVIISIAVVSAVSGPASGLWMVISLVVSMEARLISYTVERFIASMIAAWFIAVVRGPVTGGRDAVITAN